MGNKIVRSLAGNGCVVIFLIQQWFIFWITQTTRTKSSRFIVRIIDRNQGWITISSVIGKSLVAIQKRRYPILGIDLFELLFQASAGQKWILLEKLINSLI